MNRLIQFKRSTAPFLILLVLACLALLQKAQAVSPAPDGGYPRFTTAEGSSALQNLTTGVGNTATGWHSLFANTAGNLNTAVGAGSLHFNTADSNTAIGAGALLSNTIGCCNTAIGSFALFHATDIGGNSNTATGFETLLSNTTGNSNTAYGLYALGNNTTGNNNTALGMNAGVGVATANNVICIGSFGSDVSNTTWISNVYGVTTQNGTTAPVIVSADGQLGTAASSERFKKDIATMEKASEAVLALKPVTFHYKSDKTNTPQFGLVAEEVAAVNPDLVVPAKEGKPFAVRYDAVNAMLLNEFLKEHRTVQEQGQELQKQAATIAKQQKQIEALTAGLQKVSAQLELNKPAPQTVLN
jgi:hypothetical protein